MNKRNTIIVVFRIAAILALFTVLSNLSSLVSLWASSQDYDHSTVSLFSKFFQTIMMIGVPVGISIMLWNKSGWITDKILGSIEKDAFTLDETTDQLSVGEIADENQADLDSFMLESSVLVINSEEIMTIALSILGIWLFITSIPELISEFQISSFFGSIGSNIPGISPVKYYWIILSPLCKTLLSVWLIFRANNFAAWLNAKRERRKS